MSVGEANRMAEEVQRRVHARVAGAYCYIEAEEGPAGASSGGRPAPPG